MYAAILLSVPVHLLCSRYHRRVQPEGYPPSFIHGHTSLAEAVVGIPRVNHPPGPQARVGPFPVVVHEATRGWTLLCDLSQVEEGDVGSAVAHNDDSNTVWTPIRLCCFCCSRRRAAQLISEQTDTDLVKLVYKKHIVTLESTALPKATR